MMSRPGPGCTTFAALHPPSGLPTVPDVSHRPFRCSEIKVVAMQVTRRASGSPCCGHAGWPYAHALHAAAGITLVRDRGCEAVGGRRAVVRYRVPSRFPRTPPAVGAVARGVRYGQRPHDRDRAVRAVTGQRTRQDASCATPAKLPPPPHPHSSARLSQPRSLLPFHLSLWKAQSYHLAALGPSISPFSRPSAAIRPRPVSMAL